MHCVVTISDLMCNYILFRVKMNKITGTRNSIQWCVNMETSNTNWVLKPKYEGRHDKFRHEKMLVTNGNYFNIIKIYDSFYRVHTCAFGYHEMWLGLLRKYGHWIRSYHTYIVNVHKCEWSDWKIQYYTLITIKYMQLWAQVL